MVVLEGVSFLNARWNPSIVTKLVSDESLHFFAFLRGGIGTCVTHSSRLLFLRFLLLLFRYFRRIILEIETEIILVCFLLFGRCYPEWEQPAGYQPHGLHTQRSRRRSSDVTNTLVKTSENGTR